MICSVHSVSIQYVKPKKKKIFLFYNTILKSSWNFKPGVCMCVCVCGWVADQADKEHPDELLQVFNDNTFKFRYYSQAGGSAELDRSTTVTVQGWF